MKFPFDQWWWISTDFCLIFSPGSEDFTRAESLSATLLGLGFLLRNLNPGSMHHYNEVSLGLGVDDDDENEF